MIRSIILTTITYMLTILNSCKSDLVTLVEVWPGGRDYAWSMANVNSNQWKTLYSIWASSPPDV